MLRLKIQVAMRISNAVHKHETRFHSLPFLHDTYFLVSISCALQWKFGVAAPNLN